MYKIPQKKCRLKPENYDMSKHEYETKYRPFIHEHCPCVVCGAPAASHHITHKSIKGNRRRNDRVIALCHTHHQGVEGIHVLNEEWYERYIPLDRLLELSSEQLSSYLESLNN